MVYGERIFVFSGEFHPYRLPVPDLWLDVFQKVKALGFNAVSFYVHWALLEGEPGTYLANGVLAFEPFFEAAKKAGIFLIARPGPYINAESSGGGFPGWLQRIRGQLRTRAPDYLAATDNYAANIGATIAKAQITNGGPVILVQPENEYSGGNGNVTGGYPDPVYFAYVKKQLRDAGIIVPLISNDACKCWRYQNQAYINIFQMYKAYSLLGMLLTELQKEMSTYMDMTLIPWALIVHTPMPGRLGPFQQLFMFSMKSRVRRHLIPLMNSRVALSTLGADWLVSFPAPQYQNFKNDSLQGFDQCSILLNMEFERVFYKNNFAAGVELLNIYMICRIALMRCSSGKLLTVYRRRNKLGQPRSCW
jgi:beta-galactosidase GanA